MSRVPNPRSSLVSGSRLGKHPKTYFNPQVGSNLYPSVDNMRDGVPKNQAKEWHPWNIVTICDDLVLCGGFPNFLVTGTDPAPIVG